MPIMFKYVAALTVLLYVFNASAEEQTFQGFGTASCAKFAEMYRVRPDETEPLFFGWAQGFMSGLNTGVMLARGKTTDLGRWTIEHQEQEVRMYCNSYPLESYVKAVFKLYDDMRDAQGLPNWRFASQ
jgi:hypothetical protein